MWRCDKNQLDEKFITYNYLRLSNITMREKFDARFITYNYLRL